MLCDRAVEPLFTIETALQNVVANVLESRLLPSKTGPSPQTLSQADVSLSAYQQASPLSARHPEAGAEGNYSYSCLSDKTDAFALL